MKYIADINKPKSMHLEIVHDPAVGYYLYVWENGVGVDDELQDSLEIVFKHALEKYGVTNDQWKLVH